MSDLETNIRHVRETIAEAAVRCGRSPDSITLVGASKTVPAERVLEAVELGLTDLGENFVQEAAPKIEAVRQGTSRGVTWHMIGHLQTNKVRLALQSFDIIETVDSVRLATAISKRSAPGRTRILLEVYIGSDGERSGLRPDDVGPALDEIQKLPGVSIEGLMTVAPLGLDPTATKHVFGRVRELRDRLVDERTDVTLDTLSMGMTDDFPLAIEEGATLVRVGRAIFGARP